MTRIDARFLGGSTGDMAYHRDRRWRACIHEAGHAILIVYLGGCNTKITATLRGGRCSGVIHPDRVLDPEFMGLIAIAGRAAIRVAGLPSMAIENRHDLNIMRRLAVRHGLSYHRFVMTCDAQAVDVLRQHRQPLAVLARALHANVWMDQSQIEAVLPPIRARHPRAIARPTREWQTLPRWRPIIHPKLKIGFE